MEKFSGHERIFGELFWNVLQRVQMHLIFSTFILLPFVIVDQHESGIRN
jgi:hypothetical protein